MKINELLNVELAREVGMRTGECPMEAVYAKVALTQSQIRSKIGSRKVTQAKNSHARLIRGYAISPNAPWNQTTQIKPDIKGIKPNTNRYGPKFLKLLRTLCASVVKSPSSRETCFYPRFLLPCSFTI